MFFTKRLREGVREGRITCTIRIWQRPRVKVGGVYKMEDGHIVNRSGRLAITSIRGAAAWRHDR